MKRILGLCAALAGLAIWTAVALLPDDGRPTATAQDLGAGVEWISEDIEAGYAQAKETGKPLLVAFR